MPQNMGNPLKPSLTTSNENTPWAYNLDKQSNKENFRIWYAPTKPTNANNQPGADFDMETFDQKDRAKTVFGNWCNTEEGNTNL